MAKLSFMIALLLVVLASCANYVVAQEADRAKAKKEAKAEAKMKKEAKECSTEKVNDTCTVTIDRSYPVAVPTIQMRPGEKVRVKIDHPLPFEILSLDLQGAQAVAGTDQTAAFVTAAVPNLKGLIFLTQLATSKTGITVNFDGGPPASIKKYIEDLDRVKEQMDAYARNATTVYAQLNEVLGTIPSDVLPAGQRPSSSKVSQNFPRPWAVDDYPKWRLWMLCEIGGGEECPGPRESGPPVRALLAAGASLVSALAPCAKPPDQPDQKVVTCQMAAVQTEIGKMTQDDQDFFAPFLQALNNDKATLSADSAAIAAINTDLGKYWANIQSSSVITVPVPLAVIVDPFDSNTGKNVTLQKSLGRQVVFAMNAVNEVGTPDASVLTATQKKSIVTITVLYADPRFEVSTGALFSMLPNRSFANQTLVTQNSGASPTPGNVVISQTIARPTVVLFAGGNWRVCHDFRWWDKRRGAVYLTGTAGVNVNNTAAEFGVGPSLSWRSVMFSVLYDWGHDVRLTQGEFVGQVWCNQTAPSSNGLIPKCSGNPPSPSAEKYWRGSVAFGISVRVATVFGGGSSGASH
jgi:hypothetical protein